MVKIIIDMENEGADDVYQFTPSQSSQGYAGLEAKIETDESRCGIDRSELWSRGREDYNQQFQEGNVEIDGSNDILTMALGTPEYSGCVRGIGFHVSHRQYFHQPTPTKKQQSFDLKQWQDEQTRKMQQMLKE
ncbi:hypothetical protein PanWU01x14_348180 [Parasponia andersonii]|uniref:Uncharacterized protein n=1 Tax=Parasponia andersonii TaxID=3476 RepID=A0A2P5ABR2_PARAD|nr:hypothetical protein PanWU01x14_348180 [Parasponia andersonii]